jgi:hypothetical protein
VTQDGVRADHGQEDFLRKDSAIMIKRFAVALVALLLALVPVAAFAQTGVTLQTGFQVQNLGTGLATVTVTYYNLSDGAQAATQTDTIPAGGSFTYFGATLKAPTGFKGSVVISADQPIAAIGNVLGTNTDGAKTAGSYNGFSGGASTVSLPILQKGNNGINSFVSVQNTGSTDATVTITYAPAGAGNGNASSESATIKTGAAKIFDQATNTAIGTKFVGSATVVSTNGQPIVATVSQLGTTVIKTQSIYDGFTAGSTTVLLPLIIANNSGIFTGVSVQNAGTAATNITIKFGPNTATGAGTLCATPPDLVQNAVAAGGSLVTLSNNATTAPGGCKYVGSATVTNSAAQPLVATVNQASATTGSTYEGFDPAKASKTISVPLVQANNSNIFSAVQIQNTGTADTSITIKYSANSATGAGVCGAVADVTSTIAGGSSKSFFNNAGLPTAGCKYVGSVTVTSTTQNIVATVNQLQSPGTGDQLTTYNGFNQ